MARSKFVPPPRFRGGERLRRGQLQRPLRASELLLGLQGVGKGRVAKATQICHRPEGHVEFLHPDGYPQLRLESGDRKELVEALDVLAVLLDLGVSGC